MQSWAGLFSLTGSAAASLLGLLFVSVTISASRVIEADDGIGDLTEQAFQNYLLTILVSGVCLMPDMTPRTTGATILALISVSVAWSIKRVFSAATRLVNQRDSLFGARRLGSSLIGNALMMASAVVMALYSTGEFHVLSAGLLVLLGSSITTSWGFVRSLMRNQFHSGSDDS